MTTKTNGSALLGYPYEGAFFWFIGDESVRRYRSAYYQTLYGPEREKIAVRAAALACLFPHLILAPADAQLPDRQSCTVGRNYEHPDLRISLDWDRNEWSDEVEEVVKAALTDETIRRSLAALEHIGSDDSKQRHFLSRLVLQHRLAREAEATLIGNTAFQRISALAVPWINRVSTPSGAPGPVIPISPQTLDIVGLNFSPGDLGAFAAIRGSKEITAYATEFRKALFTATTTDELDVSLLELMRSAMASAEVSKKVAGGLSTVGSALGPLGMIPGIGTITGAAGMATDVGSRISAKVADRNRWYLIGAKMNEVALGDLLRNRVDKTKP